MNEGRIPSRIEKRILVGKAEHKLRQRLEAADGTLVVMPYQNLVAREHLRSHNPKLLFGAENQGLRFQDGKYYAWVSDQTLTDEMDDATAAMAHSLDDEVEIPLWFAKAVDFGYRLRTSGTVARDLYDAERKLLNTTAADERLEEKKAYQRRQHTNLFVKLLERSNCHRTMLAVLGVPLTFIQTQEGGSGGEFVAEVFAEDMATVAETVGAKALVARLDHVKEEDFPVVVNEFKMATSKPTRFWQRSRLESISATHSFIVVGRNKKNEYVCFHKMGIGVNQRIGLDPLSGAVDMADTEDGYTVHPLRDADRLLEQHVGAPIQKGNL